MDFQFPSVQTSIEITTYITFLNCHVTTGLKCHVTFWVTPPHPESGPYQILGAMGLVNVEI